MITKPSKLRTIFGLLFIFFVLDAYGSKKVNVGDHIAVLEHNVDVEYVVIGVNLHKRATHFYYKSCHWGNRGNQLTIQAEEYPYTRKTICMFSDFKRDGDEWNKELEVNNAPKEISDDTEFAPICIQSVKQSLIRDILKDLIKKHGPKKKEQREFTQTKWSQYRQHTLRELRAKAEEEVEKSDLQMYIQNLDQKRREPVDMEQTTNKLLHWSEKNDADQVKKLIHEVKCHKQVKEFVQYLVTTKTIKSLFENIHFKKTMKCAKVILELFEVHNKPELIRILTTVRYWPNRTLLLEAISHGELQMAKKILSIFGDFNKMMLIDYLKESDYHGRNALMYAAGPCSHPSSMPDRSHILQDIVRKFNEKEKDTSQKLKRYKQIRFSEYLRESSEYVFRISDSNIRTFYSIAYFITGIRGQTDKSSIGDIDHLLIMIAKYVVGVKMDLSSLFPK